MGFSGFGVLFWWFGMVFEAIVSSSCVQCLLFWGGNRIDACMV